MNKLEKMQKTDICGLIVIFLLASSPCFKIGVFSIAQIGVALASNLITVSLWYLVLAYILGEGGLITLLGTLLMAVHPLRLSELYIDNQSRLSVVVSFLALLVFGIYCLIKKVYVTGILSCISFTALAAIMRVIGNVNYPDIISFRSRGMYLNQYFFAFNFAGNQINYYDSGLEGALPAGAGFTVVVLAIGCMYFMFVGDLKKNAVRNLLLVLGFVSILLSLNAMPWDVLVRHRGTDLILKALVSPAYFSLLAGAFLTLAGCIAMRELEDNKGQLLVKRIALALFILAFMLSVFMVYSIMNGGMQ